jgi:hypothetical protein
MPCTRAPDSLRQCISTDAPGFRARRAKRAIAIAWKRWLTDGATATGRASCAVSCVRRDGPAVTQESTRDTSEGRATCQPHVAAAGRDRPASR